MSEFSRRPAQSVALQKALAWLEADRVHIVESIALVKRDPETAEPVLDEHGEYVYDESTIDPDEPGAEELSTLDALLSEVRVALAGVP